MTLLGPGDVHVLGVEGLAEKDHREIGDAEGKDATPEASTASNYCLEGCSSVNIL